MEEFFPSEIARLVLGYLENSTCLNSWKSFFEECTDLQEYSRLFKEGKKYSTNVNGKSLSDILNEYCVLKTDEISNNPGKCTCNCSCCQLCNWESEKSVSSEDASNLVSSENVNTQTSSSSSKDLDQPANTLEQDERSRNRSQGKRPASCDINSAKTKKLLLTNRIANNLQSVNDSDCIEVIELDVEKDDSDSNMIMSEQIKKNNANSSHNIPIQRVTDFQKILSNNLVTEEKNKSNNSEQSHSNNYNSDKLNQTVKQRNNEDVSFIPSSEIKQEITDDDSINTREPIMSETESTYKFTFNRDIKVEDLQINPESFNDKSNASESKGPSPIILNCTSLRNINTMECDGTIKTDSRKEYLQISHCKEQNLIENISPDSSNDTSNEEFSNKNNNIVPISHLSNQLISENGAIFPDVPMLLIPGLPNESLSQNYLQYSVVLNSGFNCDPTNNVRILPKPMTNYVDNSLNKNKSLALKSAEVSSQTKETDSNDLTRQIKNCVCILPKTNFGEESNNSLSKIQKVNSQASLGKKANNEVISFSSLPKKQKVNSQVSSGKKANNEVISFSSLPKIQKVNNQVSSGKTSKTPSKKKKEDKSKQKNTKSKLAKEKQMDKRNKK